MLALGAIGVAAPASATNGYFSSGTSIQSKGMAGAGVAIGTGVMGAAQNPATALRYGNQAEACLSLFAPDRSVTVSPGGPLTAGTFTSNKTLFPVPCGGVNFQLNDSTTLGVLLYGNGGLNTEYDTNFFAGLGAGSSPLGVNLEQLFLSVNLAHQVNDRVTVGIAPVIAAQRFSATGLEAFAGLSAFPGQVTNRGDDFAIGVGLNLGALVELAPGLTLGANYRTRIDMDNFDRYAGLFAEAGDFDIPATVALGLAYTPQANPALTLTAEWQRIFYGDVAAIANTSAPPGGPLGTANGVGFGWKDMDVVRISAEYRYSPKWTLRGGVSWNSEFADPPEAVINTLAPATPQWHASIGATYEWSDRRAIHMSYTHVFDNSLSGANPALTGVAQQVSERMSQNELSVAVTWKW